MENFIGFIALFTCLLLLFAPMLLQKQPKAEQALGGTPPQISYFFERPSRTGFVHFLIKMLPKNLLHNLGL